MFLQGHIKKFFCRLAFLLAVVLLCCGCTRQHMSDKERIIAYLNSKYEDTFSFQSWSWEHYGSQDANANVSCKSMPGKFICVGQRETDDGTLRYFDDYMAYQYESDIQQVLLEKVQSVYQDCKVIFMVDSSQFPDDMDATMSVHDIITNPDTVLSVYFITQSDDEAGISRLREAFADSHMRVRGDVYFTDNKAAYQSISQDTYADWYYQDWYTACCQFSMDKNYEFYYADWLK